MTFFTPGLHQRCGVGGGMCEGLAGRHQSRCSDSEIETDRQGAPQHSDPPIISLSSTLRSGGGCPKIDKMKCTYY